MMVDVEPLRKAFKESGLNGWDVAKRLGWMRTRRPVSILKNGRRVYYAPRQVPDSSRVSKVLGLRKYDSRGKKIYRKKIHYETAVKLCRALNIDPIDVGL
jgi:hypothetical protein